MRNHLELNWKTKIIYFDTRVLRRTIGDLLPCSIFINKSNSKIGTHLHAGENDSIIYSIGGVHYQGGEEGNSWVLKFQ